MVPTVNLPAGKVEDAPAAMEVSQGYMDEGTGWLLLSPTDAVQKDDGQLLSVTGTERQV